MSLGLTEVILIFIAVVVLFGGKKIPELIKGLSQREAEYKKNCKMAENEVSEFESEKVNTKAEKSRGVKKNVKKALKSKKPVAKVSKSKKPVAKAKKSISTKTSR